MRHFFHHKASLFFICLFYFFGQLNAQTVSPKLVTLPLEVDSIQKNVYWLVDTTQKWTIDSVQELTFQPFDFSKGIPFNPYHTFWFKFSLQNESKHDSLDALLCIRDFSTINFYTFEGNQKINYQKGGDFTSVQNRAFRPNELCFHIKIPPYSSQDFFFSGYHFDKKHREPFFLNLKSYKQEALDRKLMYAILLPKFVFYGLFSGIMLFLLCYSLIQFNSSYDKAFLFYALYLLSTYLYHLRSFESDPGWNFPVFFSYFMEYKKVVEVFFEFSGFIFYMLFIQYFLNLAKDSSINKFLTFSIQTFIVFIILDFIFQLTLGLRTSFTIHNYLRLLYFIPAFGVVFHIFFNQKNRLYQYVFLGTLILMLGSAYTLIGQLLPVKKHFYFGEVIKGYEIEGFCLYFFNMRSCILLEVICFAFGLSYKNSQRWKNYLFLNEKVAQQNLQIQKITNTPIHNENVPDEFLQKVAILLEENYKEVNFGTKELANLLHISRSKLARQLKSRKQLSPSNLIRQYRLEKARNLILTTDLTLAEIAHLTGFNEATYFSKSFKDFYQMNPSDLRLPQ